MGGVMWQYEAQGKYRLKKQYPPLCEHLRRGGRKTNRQRGRKEDREEEWRERSK